MCKVALLLNGLAEHLPASSAVISEWRQTAG
jgi:hypothetical protein